MEHKITRRLLLGGAIAFLAEGPLRPALGAEVDVDVLKNLKNLDHEKFMRLAIAQGKKVPDCPFGSVIVDTRTLKVVGEGWVRVGKNPIWHGEMTAIDSCKSEEPGFDWKSVCLYTTGESCPMCQSAIIWTGMPMVVYGSSMPFLQSLKFGEINIRATVVNDASLKGKCQIVGGILEEECNQLFRDARNIK